MTAVADLNLTPEEIEELAEAAYNSSWWPGHVPDWNTRGEGVRAKWRAVARAVLRKRQEQALEKLARDLPKVIEHSYPALAWIEGGQVRCCSSLCREDETCDRCEEHGCHPVLVIEEEVGCRG